MTMKWLSPRRGCLHAQALSQGGCRYCARKKKQSKKKKRKKKDGSININASPSNMPRQSSFLPPGVVLKNISDMWRGSGFTLFQLQNRLIILLLRIRGNFSLLFFYFFPLRRPAKTNPILLLQIDKPGITASATGSAVCDALWLFAPWDVYRLAHVRTTREEQK